MRKFKISEFKVKKGIKYKLSLVTENYVFYSTASNDERCKYCLLFKIDSRGIAREIEDKALISKLLKSLAPKIYLGLVEVNYITKNDKEAIESMFYDKTKEEVENLVFDVEV